MDVNLTIDQGNSAAKLSVFGDDRLLFSCRKDRLTPADVSQVIRQFSVTKAIYSSVAGRDTEVLAELHKQLRTVYELSADLPLPLTLDYTTPHSLGHDRIAAAAGAITLLPGRNVLIVDAGTAVTYDFVTANRHFLGGNIGPGISLQLAALSHDCVQLPQVEPTGETPLLGHDTVTAIRAGVVEGIVAQASYLAHRLSEQYEEVAVVLTGGDGALISSLLTDVDKTVNNDLVAIGLNSILKYNELL